MTLNEVLLIIGMTAVTFIPRYGVLALLGRLEMPKPIFRALRYVPVTVLSAIIFPDLFLKKESEKSDQHQFRGFRWL